MKQESATDPGDYVQHPVINHHVTEYEKECRYVYN